MGIDLANRSVLTAGGFIYRPRGMFSFEFRAKNGMAAGTLPLTEIFFVIPPSEITVAEGYRVNVTKTFGGGFVTDFGNDYKQITLSGEIYMYQEETIGLLPMLGVDQFFQLRYALSRWRDFFDGAPVPQPYLSPNLYSLRNQIGFEGRDGTLYDAIEIVFHDYDDNNHYSVVIDDFSMTRTADDPWTISYTIAMTAIRDRTPQPLISGDLLRKLSPAYWLSYLSKLYTDIYEAITLMQTGYQLALEAYGVTAQTISATREKIRKLKNGATNTYTDLLRTGQQISSAAIKLLAKFVRPRNEGAPNTVQSAAVYSDSIRDMAAGVLLQHAGMATEGLETIISSGNWRRSSVPPIANVGEAENLPALSTTDFDAGRSAGEPVDEGAFHRQVSVQYQVKQNETVEDIAQRLTGSPWNAMAILQFNNILASDFDDEGMVGEIIQVPVRARVTPQDDKTPIYSRVVFTTDPKKLEEQNLGTDLALNDNGGLVADANGDLLMVRGVECLAENLLDRTTHRVGSLNPAHPGWGMEVVPGTVPTDIRGERMFSIIEGQLMKDPRVSRATVKRDLSGLEGVSLSYEVDIEPVSGKTFVIDASGVQL